MAQLLARVTNLVKELKAANSEMDRLDRGISRPGGGDRRQAMELAGLRGDVRTVMRAVTGPAAGRSARL